MVKSKLIAALSKFAHKKERKFKPPICEKESAMRGYLKTYQVDGGEYGYMPDEYVKDI